LPTLPPCPLRVTILCGEMSRLRLPLRLVQSTSTLSRDACCHMGSQDKIIEYHDELTAHEDVPLDVDLHGPIDNQDSNNSNDKLDQLNNNWEQDEDEDEEIAWDSTPIIKDKWKGKYNEIAGDPHNMKLFPMLKVLPYDQVLDCVLTASLDHVKQLADALFPPGEYKCINVWTYRHQEYEFTFHEDDDHESNKQRIPHGVPVPEYVDNTSCSNCIALYNEIEHLHDIIEKLEADKKRLEEMCRCHCVVHSNDDSSSNSNYSRKSSHCRKHTKNIDGVGNPDNSDYDYVMSSNNNKDNTEPVMECANILSESKPNNGVIDNSDEEQCEAQERQDKNDCQRIHINSLSNLMLSIDNTIDDSSLKGRFIITTAWGAFIIDHGPLRNDSSLVNPTTAAAAAATAALRGELDSKIHYAEMTHRYDPNRVPVVSLILIHPNDPLNQTSLMTRRQVQVHHQHCLTTKNGKTAVFVIAKAIATTCTRVGSKKVLKISREWGENKMTDPDFY
jgi:hypothetical protein